MKSRKTVMVVCGSNPEPNRFEKVKKILISKSQTGLSTQKKNQEKCQKKADEFEEFLWENADAEFYKQLRIAMNMRRMNAGF
jgi:BRCT domain type II-containing protein